MLPGIPKQRMVFRNTTFAPPIAYGVHQNCIGNVLRGLVERVYFVEGANGLQHPPEAAANVFYELRAFARDVARRVGKATPVSLHQFAEMYRGRKRTIYLEAYRSLCQQGVSLRDARIAAFVKAEKILFEAWGRIYDPAPRLIQPRTPRYNAALGRFLKPIEHLIYHMIDRVWGGPTVMKGLNAEERGSAFVYVTSKYRNPVYFSSDYSRFDQSIGDAALRFEHSFYLSLFPGYTDELSKLLKMQLVNKGVARCPDGRIEYSVRGCRMSGDMNTSLGNVFLACAVAHGYMKQSGIKMSLLNDGDDCVFVMEREDARAFIAGFAPYVLRFGFRAKVEAPVHELAEVDFCQCSPIWTPGGTIMVRNPWKALPKDATSILPLDQPRLAQRLYTSLGEGGAAMSAGIPVYQSLYKSLADAGGGVRFNALPGILDSGFQYMHRGVRLVNTAVHPRTRYEFWRAFHILPDQQLALEDHFSLMQVPTVPAPGYSPPTESVTPLIVKFKHTL